MDLLDRLHHALRGALERSGPRTRPLTIAELYQQLIPYRAVRGELGVWELAEYEHALLRLLAGEGGHLAVAAPEAREEFRRELASPNPILGIYRDYATVEVELGAAGALPLQPPRLPEPAAPEPAPAPVLARPACHACGTELPGLEGVRFCPACGADQHAGPCRECGAPLKPEWNFCIRCGTPREGERPDRGGG